jgi:hypothetical protein
MGGIQEGIELSKDKSSSDRVIEAASAKLFVIPTARRPEITLSPL